MVAQQARASFLIDLPIATQNVVDEFVRVTCAIFQRRQFDRQDVDAVVEVLAKVSLFDLERQVAVGCCNDSHIDASFLVRADSPHRTVFQDTQKFRLQAERHFADLVDEQCSAVGDFEQA